jgi:release factor glutamine methyltransferase
MPLPEWTILSLLEWTTGYFRKFNIDTPRLDAEILLAHSLGLRRIDLYLRYDQPLGTDELAAFRKIVKRRAAREPVAYIIGRWAFWGLDLLVDSHVLTPRPETERVVEVALSYLAGKANGNKASLVMDLGTGSGCIALALAHDCPAARVVATDSSLPALMVARRNIERQQMADRIQLVAGSDLTMFDPSHRRFDLIVANPPYIPSTTITSLQPEVRDYEPRCALDGGVDGLAAYRRILPEAATRLRAGGALVLEIGWDQGPAVAQLVERSGLYRNWRCAADYGGHDRVMHMTRI